MRGLWCAGALAGALAVSAGGRAQERDAGSVDDRVVYRFDFDETDNPSPVPRHWLRLEGPGYPSWNQDLLGFVEGDEAASNGADFACGIGTRGGSAGLRLTPGVIAALPNTEYLLTCRARTRGLARARGYVSAGFTDARNEVMEGTVVDSAPILTSNVWQDVALRFTTRDPQATWIVLEMRLEQAAQQKRERKQGVGEALLEDVSGAVEFDDITLWRIPQTELSVGGGNFLVGTTEPTVSAVFQDMLRSEVRVTLAVRDREGNVADETAAIFGPERRRLAWAPKLPGYGWYHVTMSVEEMEGGVEGGAGPASVLPTAEASFVCMADLPRPSRTLALTGGPEGDGIGIIADGLDASGVRESLPPLLALEPDHVTLPAWVPSTTRGRLNGERDALADLFAPLSAAGTRVNLALPVVPRDVLPAGATAGSRFDVLAALRLRGEALWPYVSEYAASFSPGARTWQLGGSRNESMFTQRALLGSVDAALGMIRRGSRQTRVALPWSADESLPEVPGAEGNTAAVHSAGNPFRNGDVRFLIRVPEEYAIEAVAELVRRLQQGGEPADYLLEPLDEDLFGSAAAADDLVKRAVAALHEGAPMIALDAPWEFPVSPEESSEAGPEGVDGWKGRAAQPTHLFGPWRTLTAMLSQAAPAGRLELAPGVVGRVFRRGDNSGTLVVWSEATDADEYEASLFLGNEPVRMVDVDGNATEVPLGADGLHHLTIGREAKYVTGADINLALFRAGFSITPNVIEASAERHAHEIILSNPWPTAISGTLRIVEPRRWRIDERAQHFEIPAGGSVRLPMEFTLPAYEYAGRTQVVLHVDLDTGQRLSTDLTAPMDVGLLGVTFRAEYAITEGSGGKPGDVVVTVEVANGSENAARLRAVCIAPKSQPQQAMLGSVPAGQTTRRVFRFPGAAGRLKGETIRVGIKNAEGDGQLNLLLPIE